MGLSASSYKMADLARCEGAGQRKSADPGGRASAMGEPEGQSVLARVINTA